MMVPKTAINQRLPTILSFHPLVHFSETARNILTVSLNNIDMYSLCGIYFLSQSFIYPYTVKTAATALSIRLNRCFGCHSATVSDTSTVNGSSACPLVALFALFSRCKG